MSAQEITFRLIEDPGHGWLEVQECHSRAVGIKPDQYSTCSYYRSQGFGKDNILYLEEDLDAGRFVKAWEAKYGKIKIAFVHEEQSTVRPLPHLSGANYVSPFNGGW